MSPRIAIVCPGCGAGGSVAAVALRHAALLGSRGSVTLFSDGFPAASDGRYRRETVRSPSFRWLRRFAHVPREYAFALKARRALERAHAREGLDVVLCHGHVAAAIVAERLKRRHGVPIAMVTHGDIFDRPAGTYDPRLTRWYRAVTPRAYRVADLVLALSPPMAVRAVDGGADAAGVRVLPNGVDPADIGLAAGARGRRAAGAAGAPGPLRVLYAGTLARHKGVFTLVEACDALHARAVPFELTIVGSGPDGEALAAEIARRGLAGRVRLAGAVRRDALGERYLDSDVVCVPSLTEALPTVALEALAAGRPVVGSTAGGIPSLVHDGVNGLLFPPGDATALAGALGALAADRSRLASLAGAARASVLPEYSWDAVGARLWGCLGELMARRGFRGGPAA